MKFMTRALLLVSLLLATLPSAQAAQALPAVLDDAQSLPNLRTVIVAQHGKVLAERGYHGGRVDRAANIKSASKTVVTTLVGIAIDRGVLQGVDQPIAPLLKTDLPVNPDPRLATVTIGDLLSMQAGLARTSGPNYGRWVSSRNWVRYALAQPFVDAPGGGMLYSTGSTHLLSAILTRVTGKSTLQLSREWLGPQPGFAITAWARDPQGVYFGGNQMSMTPRSLLAFGELFRNGGRSSDGAALISPRWITASWTPRTHSVFTGDGYGYGWFARQIGDHEVRFAWGYGGQMLYVVPSLDLVVVMTSDPDQPSGSSGYLLALHALLAKLMDTPELAAR